MGGLRASASHRSQPDEQLDNLSFHSIITAPRKSLVNGIAG